MAFTTFVIYVTASGEIVTTCNGDDGTPPTPGAGESVLDAGLQDPMPSQRTTVQMAISVFRDQQPTPERKILDRHGHQRNPLGAEDRVFPLLQPLAD